MATAKNNPLLAGLRGKMGDVVVRQVGDIIVVQAAPDRSRVKLSAKQKKANNTFKQAVAYAKKVAADPEKIKAYMPELLEGRKSIYHIALADFIKTGGRV